MGLLSGFSGANESIGIDIGSHTIKVVQIAATRTGYLVTHAGSTPTPRDAVKQGVIDNRLAVAEAIRDLVKRIGSTSSLAVAAVAGPTVVVRQVQLPAMPEHQLRKSIYWEARNYISFPVEDSLLEFQILGTQTTDGTPQMDVMLVATPRDLVDSRVETLEMAGLDPIAVELEPFALMRSTIAARVLPAADSNETIALVDIGATYTHISIMSGRVFVLSRSVSSAGNNLTEAIAGALGAEMASRAEEIKENETAIVADEAARAQLTPAGQLAGRAIEPLIETLVTEIRRSFAFYDSQRVPSGQQETEGVSRVLLAGGTTKLKGLPEFLENQLGLPVTPIDLFGQQAIVLPEGADELPAMTPFLATAVGLALREPMIEREKEVR